MEIYTKYGEYEDSLWVSDSPMKLQDGQWAVVITADDGEDQSEASVSAYVTSEGLDQLIPELTRLREEIRTRQEQQQAREAMKTAQLIELQKVKYFNKGDGTWLCEDGHIHTNSWFDGETDIKIITP